MRRMPALVSRIRMEGLNRDRRSLHHVVDDGLRDVGPSGDDAVREDGNGESLDVVGHDEITPLEKGSCLRARCSNNVPRGLTPSESLSERRDAVAIRTR